MRAFMKIKEKIIFIVNEKYLIIIHLMYWKYSHLQHYKKQLLICKNEWVDVLRHQTYSYRRFLSIIIKNFDILKYIKLCFKCDSNLFTIIFYHKFTMKLAVIVALLAVCISINALKMSGVSHLQKSFLVIGDSLSFNDNIGDVTINYKFKGQSKTATYRLTQYFSWDHNYIIWLFIQKGSSFKFNGDKTVSKAFQWGTVNSLYFMVEQDANLRSHNILQGQFYDAGQRLQASNDEFYTIKPIPAKENIPLYDL